MFFLYRSFLTLIGVIVTRLLAFIALPFLSHPTLGYALTPAIGFYGSNFHAFLAYALHTTLSVTFYPVSVSSLITHMPTFLGTLFLTSESCIVRASISALCISLFLFHPVGFSCWYYIAYWIPPLIIGLLSRPSFLLQAVGSTMTTHAVGTVIWLYTHDTSSAFWSALFYRVWAERLVCIAMLIAGYYVISLINPMLAFRPRRRLTCPTG